MAGCPGDGTNQGPHAWSGSTGAGRLCFLSLFFLLFHRREECDCDTHLLFLFAHHVQRHAGGNGSCMAGAMGPGSSPLGSPSGGVVSFSFPFSSTCMHTHVSAHAHGVNERCGHDYDWSRSGECKGCIGRFLTLEHGSTNGLVVLEIGFIPIHLVTPLPW